MIASFADKATALVFTGGVPRSMSAELAGAALIKLRMVDAAQTPEDLRTPPGNRLEALRGDRAGQHSIRINRQWRVTFAWRDGAPHEVRIEDYH